MNRHFGYSLLLLCCIAVTSIVAAAITKPEAISVPGGSNKQLSGEFDLTIPGEFLKIYNLDQHKLHAAVIVNDSRRIIWRPSQPELATFSVELGGTLQVNVQWYETLADGTELLLASRNISQLVNTRDDFEIKPGAYESIGKDYDLDNDGFSNLLERLRGTDPSDASDSPSPASASTTLGSGMKILASQPHTSLSGP